MCLLSDCDAVLRCALRHQQARKPLLGRLGIPTAAMLEWNECKEVFIKHWRTLHQNYLDALSLQQLGLLRNGVEVPIAECEVVEPIVAVVNRVRLDALTMLQPSFDSFLSTNEHDELLVKLEQLELTPAWLSNARRIAQQL